MISFTQSAFILGQLITNNVTVALGKIHYMKRKTWDRKGEMALKVDIRKTYDWIDWEYLRLCMLKMDFDDCWVRWIILCVSSARYFVILNGAEFGPILPHHGLHQSDPLSLYLFIYVLRGCHLCFIKLSNVGIFMGHVSQDVLLTSHLLFC